MDEREDRKDRSFEEIAENWHGVEALAADVGMPLEKAKLLLKNGDLWLVEPTGRVALEGEEAIAAYSQAEGMLEKLAGVFLEAPYGEAPPGSRVVAMAVWDAWYRVRECRQRFEEELEE